MKTCKTVTLCLLMALGFFSMSPRALAHCEIPCGIYEDSIRISLISEHIETIEKSMNKIVDLSKMPNPDYNQLMRWVMNKEEHAKKIQTIVSQYFLHQRIKLTDPGDKEKYARYVKHLTLLHRLLVYAMKTKQTLDLHYIAKLKETLLAFKDSYFHSH